MEKPCTVTFGSRTIAGYVHTPGEDANGVPGYLVEFFSADLTREDQETLEVSARVKFKSGRGLRWFAADRVNF